MWQNTSKVLAKADFLGKNFNFYVNGSYRYKTLLGGILSILIFLSVGVLVWYFGQDIYKREKPSLLKSSTFSSEFPFYTLKQEKFNLAFRIENDNANLMNDRTYLDYRFYLLKYYIDAQNQSNIMTVQEQIPELCSEKLVDKQLFTKNNLSDYYCVTNNYTIGGDWSSNYIYMPLFTVVACDSTTEARFNVKCQSLREELNRTKQSIIFDFMIQYNLVDSINESSPIKKSYEFFFYPLNLDRNTVKLVKFKYTLADIETDSGIIFNDYRNETFLEFDSDNSIDISQDNFYSKYLNSTILGLGTLVIGRKNTIYKRSYIKLPEVLATVGGFMNSIITIVEMLYFPFWDNSIWYFLQTRLYKLEIEDNTLTKGNLEENKDNRAIEMRSFALNNNDQSGQKSLFPKKKSKAMNLYKKPIISKHSTTLVLEKESHCLKEIVLNKDLKKYLFNKSKEKTKEIKIEKCWRFLHTKILCCEKQMKALSSKTKFKYEMINAADREFLKKIEILNLFKDFDHFRVLKKIVLNEAQNFMIDHRRKQTITNSCQDLSAKDISQIIEEKYDRNIRNLFIYLQNKQSDCIVDDLLYSHLDPLII